MRYLAPKEKFVGSNDLIVTTSWDDGHPDDVRLASLLAEYGIAGTFYVPLSNVEGRDVMTDPEKKTVGARFEVAAHTVDHRVLIELSAEDQRAEISESKSRLQQIIGSEVFGFCYPRGKFNKISKEIVLESGYKYARTIRNFTSSIGADPYEMSTTMQMYPHSRSVLCRNLVSGGINIERIRLFKSIMRGDKLIDRVAYAAEECAVGGRVFHLWGHSWEVERLGGWEALEDIFKKISQLPRKVRFLTNYEVAKLVWSAHSG